ncbi:MAG: M6 family metalloprotease domain-containing protein [Firmicutes bacterium]|nr:M6 family metalloprotease domain-containing protein [Bacillota bacterium]
MIGTLVLAVGFDAGSPVMAIAQTPESALSVPPWASPVQSVPWPVHVGATVQAHLLVVCAQFAGQRAAEPISLYRQVYFGNAESVANYYADVSYGQLKISGQVIGNPLQPDVFLQLPHTEAYYAGTENGSGSPQPHNDNQMVSDVLYQLIRDHFNFTPFEQDGTLPYLAIVYTGYGADVAPQNTSLIWPVENSLVAPLAIPLSAPGAAHQKYLFVSNYDLVPELAGPGQVPTIGVFAHEFGHLMGLDDLYDTSSAANAGAGDGPWSLMAGGNWNGEPQGSEPAELDPFSRLFLGWLQPIVLDESVTGLRLPPIERAPVTYELKPAGNASDYFLVDNVEPIDYDQGLPESGVLIWHIDGHEMVSTSADWQNNDLNAPSQNVTHHYDEQVVEAGGPQLSMPGGGSGVLDDTYPGTAGNDQFTGASKPSNDLWDGHSVGISLSHIAIGPDGVATMTVVDDQTGSALMIAAPATGLYAYQGLAESLTVLYLHAHQWQDVTAKAVWDTVNPAMVRSGSTVSFQQPGYVEVLASAHGLRALLEQRVIALSGLHVLGAVTLVTGARHTLPSVLLDYANGRHFVLAGAQWSSDQPAVLRVIDGQVMAMAPGEATLSVHFAGMTATVVIHVTA